MRVETGPDAPTLKLALLSDASILAPPPCDHPTQMQRPPTQFHLQFTFKCLARQYLCHHETPKNFSKALQNDASMHPRQLSQSSAIPSARPLAPPIPSLRRPAQASCGGESGW